MQLFLSSLLLLPYFLCLSSSIAVAAPDSSGTDTTVRAVDGEATKGSIGGREADSWTSFLSPSYIFEGIQLADAYLPPALRATSLLQAFTAPKPAAADFWEMAKECEQTLQDYVPRLLENAAGYFKSTQFTDITSSMHHIVNVTTTFRNNIKNALDSCNITIDTLTGELEGVFMATVKDLESIPPPDKAPGHAERLEMVDKALDDTALALTGIAARYGIEEEVITSYLDALKPHLQALIVVVGDINEQYPDLLPALAFSVAALLIPEFWILRPLLSMFGFGPTGPVKGSAAAWLQRRFWGGAVKAGSWFAWLQAAGTGVFPKWAGYITKLPWMIGVLLALLSSCVRRG